MKQKLLISGVVEENNKRYFLIDFDEKSVKKYSDVIIKSREYKDNASKRYVALIPIELNNYELFKEQFSSCIKKLKMDRFSKLYRTYYPLNGKLIAMNLRKSVEKNFLKNKEFHDFISKNVEPNRNVIYILAVLLERKRILTERDVQTRDDDIVTRVYEHRQTGEVFLIPDPRLHLDQLEEVQKEVVLMLGGKVKTEVREQRSQG